MCLEWLVQFLKIYIERRGWNQQLLDWQYTCNKAFCLILEVDIYHIDYHTFCIIWASSKGKIMFVYIVSFLWRGGEVVHAKPTDILKYFIFTILIIFSSSWGRSGHFDNFKSKVQVYVKIILKVVVIAEIIRNIFSTNHRYII